MSKQLLIGVDIGTSGTKTVIFDTEGNAVASALFEYGMAQPKNGWAEQNPEDWWKATYMSIAAAMEKAGADKSAVAGIGLSGQMHGLVILDDQDRVIRPSIIWCDQRTAEECGIIMSDLGDKIITETANEALTGFTASKIKWVQRHEPENWAKVRKIMLPKDYIRYKLTGEFATEVSDGSGMQLMNITQRTWSKVMLDYFGIKESQLGHMYESCEATGKLTSEAAALCGLEPGVIVAGGAGDQAASAIGNGIVKTGVASITLGTSGVVFVHSDDVHIDPAGRINAFCHAVPGKWHMMGCTQGAGLSFKWFRDEIMPEIAEKAAAEGKIVNKALDDIAASVPAGAGGVIFLPYLMGERSPHPDPDARGVFFGLSASHGRAEMLRAVLEGVAYSLYDNGRAVESMGIPMSDICIAGGGANSRLWTQIIADTYGVSVSKTNSSESGALGVAILAGCAAGIYDSVPSACSSIIRRTSVTEPNADMTPVYRRFYDLYVGLYESLKDRFKTLSAINR